METAEFISRLGVAFLLGALVGVERQLRQKRAGLLTNTLVSLGAAAFVLLSISLTANAGDPSRMASQVVTGIGFLGAGVIMRTGLTVQGLNTAATLWCSAAVGTLAGAGLLVQSALVAAAILLVHLALYPLGTRINRFHFKKAESGIFYYSLKVRCKEQVETRLRALLLGALEADEHLLLRSLKSSDSGNAEFAYIEAEILANGKHDSGIEKLAGKLTLEYGVTEVRWEVSGQSSD